MCLTKSLHPANVFWIICKTKICVYEFSIFLWWNCEEVSKISLALFYGWNRLDGESRLDFCKRLGWMPGIQKMMLVDFLIANRDRHGANIEILKDRAGRLRLAPLFDNGLSLCYSTFNARDMGTIDPTQDIVANNFLGARSVEQNLLRFVPSDLPIGRLREPQRSDLIAGLPEALDNAVDGMSGQDFAEFLWRMIWERWCRYESLRDNGQLEAKS